LTHKPLVALQVDDAKMYRVGHAVVLDFRARAAGSVDQLDLRLKVCALSGVDRVGEVVTLRGGESRTVQLQWKPEDRGELVRQVIAEVRTPDSTTHVFHGTLRIWVLDSDPGAPIHVNVNIDADKIFGADLTRLVNFNGARTLPSGPRGHAGFQSILTRPIVSSARRRVGFLQRSVARRFRSRLHLRAASISSRVARFASGGRTSSRTSTVSSSATTSCSAICQKRPRTKA
jgi:hypothetical protein